MHAEARHIVCIWRIPGMNIHECNDGCDDEDYGVSQAILDWMKKQDITHKAILVVRNCAGKLYSDRMTTYIQAAEKVMKEFPMNSILHRQQLINNLHTSPDKSYAMAAASPPSNRGKPTNPSRRGGIVTRRGRSAKKGTRRTRNDNNPDRRRKETTQYTPRTEAELQLETDQIQYRFSDPDRQVSETETMDTEVL